MAAHPVAGLGIGHPAARKEPLESVGGRHGAGEPCRLIRHPPEREDRPVLGRDDVGTEPRPPDLDECRVLPGVRARARDAGVDREERAWGMLSDRPAQAARRRDRAPGGRRLSSAETRNR